jgi:hypothetical protein
MNILDKIIADDQNYNSVITTGILKHFEKKTISLSQALRASNLNNCRNTNAGRHQKLKLIIALYG